MRGFDRFRVPLSLDGVRVYLPADNRLDFNRFLTPDLSEIQIAERLRLGPQRAGRYGRRHQPGVAQADQGIRARGPRRRGVQRRSRRSSINGAATPTPARGSGATTRSSAARCSTRTTGTCRTISAPPHLAAFDPDDTNTAAIATIRNSADWRINAKVGITPNATTNTASTTRPAGREERPAARGKAARTGAAVLGLALLGYVERLVAVEDADRLASYVKSNVYYNTFENLLSSYTDADLHRPNRNSQDFNSYYDDYAYGGFIEAGTNLIPMNTLKGAIHYRRDGHSERSDIAPSRLNPAHAGARALAGQRRRHVVVRAWKTPSTRRAISTS